MADRLPEVVTMKNTMFGDGAKGMAFQRAEDIPGHGVICEARREDGRSAFKESWRYRWLPDRDFATYAELRQAVNALDDATIQREREAWPKATEFEHDSGNRCWLDGDPGAVFITVQTSWFEYGGAPLCAACGALAKADPGVVVRAIEKRQADVAARPSPFSIPTTNNVSTAAQPERKSMTTTVKVLIEGNKACEVAVEGRAPTVVKPGEFATKLISGAERVTVVETGEFLT